MIARQAKQHVDIERLGEARIGDSGRQAPRGQQIGGLQTFRQAGAERQDRHGRALADDAALADLQRLGDLGDRDADTLAARIAERRGAVVDGDGGGDHARQVRLVGGGHQHHAGQSPHEADVERAGVGRAIGAHQTGAVHRKAHRQALDRHVMDDLVVTALKEGRVDRAERLHAVGG